MAIIRTLITSVTAKTSNFERGMKRSTKATATFSKGIGSASKVLGGFGIALGTGAIISFGRNILQSADAVGKLSTRLGATTKDIQELQFIGAQTGIGFQQFSTILQRFRRRIGEASDGSQLMIKAFQDLGLNAKRLEGLGLADQFIELSRAVERSGGTTEQQIQRIGKIMDVEGVRIFQAIRGGTDALEALRMEAQNKIIPEETIRNIETFNDSVDSMIRLSKVLLVKGITGLGAGIKQNVKNLQANIDRLAALLVGLDPDLALAFDIANATPTGKPLTVTKKARPALLKRPRLSGQNGAAGNFLSPTPGPTFDNFTRKQIQGLQETKTALQELSNTGIQLSSTLSNSFESFITGAETAKEAVRSLAQEILLLTARQAFIEPAAKGAAQFLTSFSNATSP